MTSGRRGLQGSERIWQLPQIAQRRIWPITAQISERMGRASGDGDCAQAVRQATADVRWSVADDPRISGTWLRADHPRSPRQRQWRERRIYPTLVAESTDPRRNAPGSLRQRARLHEAGGQSGGAQLAPGDALDVACDKSQRRAAFEQPIERSERMWCVIGAQIRWSQSLVRLRRRNTERGHSSGNLCGGDLRREKFTAGYGAVGHARRLAKLCRRECHAKDLQRRIAERTPMRRRRPTEQCAINIEEDERHKPSNYLPRTTLLSAPSLAPPHPAPQQRCGMIRAAPAT